MKLRTRFLLAFSSIVILGACVILHWVLEDVKPRYREAAEESLNDTAHLCAALIEDEMSTEERLPIRKLQRIFTALGKRPLRAKIFQLTKKRVDLGMYVTDAKGVIVFTTDPTYPVGKDHSTWNDVYLTLRGKYGARTTRKVKDDPSTSAMFVAAPIKNTKGKLVGVVTVIKPVDAVLMFMKTVKRRIFVTAVVTLVFIILFGGVLTAWVTRPLQLLTARAHAVSEGERVPLQLSGAGEIAMLSHTIDEMREALEGRRYVEKYVQSLSHEMKAPLAAITGAAELLDEEMDKADQQKFLSNIRNESRRLKDIVDRLLVQASLESRRSLRNVEEVNPMALLREVKESLAPVASQKNIELSIQDTPTQRTIHCESFLIRHALVNLLQNAIDFTLPSGHIALSVEESDTEATIKVIDDGVGIPDYAKDKVFERFYSLERPENGRKSSGLGLAFVREVASLHQGKASITNRSEGGTVASISLPLQPMS